MKRHPQPARAFEGAENTKESSDNHAIEFEKREVNTVGSDANNKKKRKKFDD